MLHGVCCMLHGVCCMLHGVCCMLHGVCCMLHGVCCMLSVVTTSCVLCRSNLREAHSRVDGDPNVRAALSLKWKPGVASKPDTHHATCNIPVRSCVGAARCLKARLLPPPWYVRQSSAESELVCARMASSCPICAGTGLTPATSAPGLNPPRATSGTGTGCTAATRDLAP